MKREPVAAESDQDKWLARLLRRRSADPAKAAVAGVCLDADTLAAWVDGALTAKESAAAEVHASNCSRCLAVIATMERTVPAAPAPATTRGMLWRWLVPLTAVATAAAIWVAVPDERAIPVPVSSPAISAPGGAQARPPQAAPSAAPVEAPGREPLREREAAKEERRETALGAAAEIDAPPPMAQAPAAPSPSADASRPAKPVIDMRLEISKESVMEAATMDPLIRWRLVDRATIERTLDGGKTWVKIPGPAAAMVAISAVDSLSATVTTSEGSTLSTTDGGATWAPPQGKPAAPF